MISTFIFYLVPIVFVLSVRKYRANKWGKCTNTVQLDGKLAVVTGANSGIGYEVAKELAIRKASVIVACRSLETASLCAQKLQRELAVYNPTIIPMILDLSSLIAVKEFVTLLRLNHSKIDLLVNNAGVAYPRSERLQTEDGYEIHFGVNHLGHFFLTNMLIDLVVKAKGRIIVVTSTLYEKGKINLQAIKTNTFGPKENLYANSKLANIYFAQELARRYKKKGVTVYAVLPGWVYTGLFRYSFKWYHYLLAPIAFFYMRSAKQGSETIIYCATEESLKDETGLLYRDCKNYSGRYIFIDSVAKSLWAESDNMIARVINDYTVSGD